MYLLYISCKVLEAVAKGTAPDMEEAAKRRHGVFVPRHFLVSYNISVYMR